MKKITLVIPVLMLSTMIFAQTPVGTMQKMNLSYMESQEDKGYIFRSQIITEFDGENASQNVNIRLSEGFEYQLVAMGDSKVKSVNLSVKTKSGDKLKKEDGFKSEGTAMVYELIPAKSGKYRITIQAGQFEGSAGFVSFMVLRKKI